MQTDEGSESTAEVKRREEDRVKRISLGLIK